jgi:hypothetical protein
MNIFYVDRNPSVAARSLGDQHVLKMILESAQLLDTAHPVSIVRRPASVFNNPAAQWARSSKVHYQWLYSHFVALLDEYSHRFNKAHAYERYTAYLGKTPEGIPSTSTWADPPRIMPFLHHHIPNTVEAYRSYYKNDKKHLHRYTNRKAPTWLSYA